MVSDQTYLKCVDTCAETNNVYKVYGRMKVCTATCTNHFYQEDTTIISGQTYFKCAKACADNDYKVSKGSETYCYANKCPDDYKFIPASDSKECQATCANKAYMVDGSNKVCTATCDEFYEEDATVASETYLKCTDSCDSVTYRVDNGKKICAETCDKFYEEDTAVVQDEMYLKCVDTCADTKNVYQVYGGMQVCVATCDTKVYQEDTAVITGETYFKCASACASQNDYKVSKDDETYCYATKCPAGYTFISGSDDYQCMATCPSNVYEVDGDRKICMESCTTKFYQEDTDVASDTTYLKCADSCASKTYKVDINSRKICTETCAGGYYQEDTVTVDSQLYFKCDAACASSSDYKVINDKGTYCYATCPADYIFVGGSDNHQCMKTCDSNIYKINGDKKICADTCDKFYEEDNSIVTSQNYFKCVDACSDNIYRASDDKKVCATTCADHFYQEDTNTMVGNQMYFKCVDECDTDCYRISKGEDTYCYYYGCPSGYTFVDGHECLKTCNSKIYKWENGDKTCVEACDLFYNEDNSIVSNETYLRCTNTCYNTDYVYREDDDKKICTAACADHYYQEDSTTTSS